MTRIPALVIAVLAATGVAAVPAATPAAASTLPACHAADVAVHYRATDSGAGHRYGRIVMRNISSHACRSGGFGGLSYVGGGDGTQIGAAADRVGSWQAFTLQPGQRAYSPVDEVVAQNYPKATCRPASVDGFRVYIPNATRSKFVVHATTGCRNTAVHLLSHKAFRRF
ncbi:DUF4232 domain-containing protein [Nocardioides jiangxiensis]|uniref:DUF4232 domain-containing protein n=1 Tax=Nocardioides jiangxiensis TaxID=3064524 RepID=A0ABT9B3J0_9ACTN|nr:DUF4232 domain-containing protein [Nocardioides sp. WY-20]MDO7867723.1 DUF4232 domain-containing protein [Nocardioides sp. WY-20]